MWWTCHKAKRFWRQIKDISQEIIQEEIAVKPEMFSLNIMPEIVDNILNIRCLTYLQLQG